MRSLIPCKSFAICPPICGEVSLLAAGLPGFCLRPPPRGHSLTTAVFLISVSWPPPRGHSLTTAVFLISVSSSALWVLYHTCAMLAAVLLCLRARLQWYVDAALQEMASPLRPPPRQCSSILLLDNFTGLAHSLFVVAGDYGPGPGLAAGAQCSRRL